MNPILDLPRPIISKDYPTPAVYHLSSVTTTLRARIVTNRDHAAENLPRCGSRFND